MKAKRVLLFLVITVGISSTALGTSTVWSWMKDMYNQISIKPQEDGSMQEFPKGVVSTDGHMRAEGKKPIEWEKLENNPRTRLKNPVLASSKSVQHGEKLFKTYCQVCHGEGGKGESHLQQKGMPSIPIRYLVANRTDGYIYNSIRYGRYIMPRMGNWTTDKERWDIVNYIRTWEKR